jgi:hypothetical protein
MPNESAKKSASEQTAQQPKIVWDDTDMRSVYANVTNVTGGREELILLFGMNQAWQPGQKEIKVQLSERVVLSPFAAKRLAVLLSKTLAEYERQFGPLDIGAPIPPSIAS